MPDDSFDQDAPHLFECMMCGHKLTDDAGPVACPRCGEEMKNLSMPSANAGLAGPSY